MKLSSRKKKEENTGRGLFECVSGGEVGVVVEGAGGVLSEASLSPSHP